MLRLIYAVIVIVTAILVNMESNGWTELALCFLLPICMIGLIVVTALCREPEQIDPEELMHMRLYSRRRN